MSTRTIELTEGLHAYMLDASLREPELFCLLREETAKLPEASMQISPEQGQFMMLLIELAGCKRALEIGTFTGYSSLCIASAMPSDGRLIACDLSEEWTAIARRYWQRAGLDQKIDLRLGPALDTLSSLLTDGLAGTFDFAFIDADKVNGDAYYEHSLQLLRPGGLLAIDNALWDGRVADPEVNDDDTVAIRTLTRKIRDDQRVAMSLVPIGDGLLLARKLQTGPR